MPRHMHPGKHSAADKSDAANVSSLTQTKGQKFTKQHIWWNPITCVSVCVYSHTHTNMKMTQVFYSKSLDPVSVVRIREANEVFSLSVFSTFSLLHVHCRRRE